MRARAYRKRRYAITRGKTEPASSRGFPFCKQNDRCTQSVLSIEESSSRERARSEQRMTKWGKNPGNPGKPTVHLVTNESEYSRRRYGAIISKRFGIEYLWDSVYLVTSTAEKNFGRKFPCFHSLFNLSRPYLPCLFLATRSSNWEIISGKKREDLRRRRCAKELDFWERGRWMVEKSDGIELDSTSLAPANQNRIFRLRDRVCATMPRFSKRFISFIGSAGAKIAFVTRLERRAGRWETELSWISCSRALCACNAIRHGWNTPGPARSAGKRGHQPCFGMK